MMSKECIFLKISDSLTHTFIFKNIFNNENINYISYPLKEKNIDEDDKKVIEEIEDIKDVEDIEDIKDVKDVKDVKDAKGHKGHKSHIKLKKSKLNKFSKIKYSFDDVVKGDDNEEDDDEDDDDDDEDKDSDIIYSKSKFSDEDDY